MEAEDDLTQPMYSFPEAARYAGVSTSAARNWLLGYTGPGGDVEPLFGATTPVGDLVSFLQLIEIAVAGRFRKAERVKLDVVRQAHRNAQDKYGLAFPFAHKRLSAFGGHIVEAISGQRYQSVDEPERVTLPAIVENLRVQLDYAGDGLASLWYPRGREAPIVLNPRVSAGRPTIPDRGVTIDMLVWRWKKVGESIAFIADDFDLPPEQVERALQYAEGIAA